MLFNTISHSSGYITISEYLPFPAETFPSPLIMGESGLSDCSSACRPPRSSYERIFLHSSSVRRALAIATTIFFPCLEAHSTVPLPAESRCCQESSFLSLSSLKKNTSSPEILSTSADLRQTVHYFRSVSLNASPCRLQE